MNIPAHTKVPWFLDHDEQAGTKPTSVGCFGSRKRAASPYSRQGTKVLHPSGFFFVCAPQHRHAPSNGKPAVVMPNNDARGNGGDRVEPGGVVMTAADGLALVAPFRADLSHGC